MKEDYKLLVQRYLEKKSTDEELEVFVFLMKQGKLDEYLEEAMNADLGLESEVWSAQSAEELFVAPQKKGRYADLFSFSFLTAFKLPVAAAATITLLAGFLIFLYTGKQPQTPVTQNIRIYNSTTEILKKTLPDGTDVWLNPGTIFNYPSKFGKLREVSMQGEAFFDVVKDPKHPFQISSGKILTKVFGTSFRIRSIPGEPYTKVSVLTGKVSVSALPGNVVTTRTKPTAIPNEVMLIPEHEVTYNQNNHQLLKARIEEDSDMALWRKAELSFENTSLAEIVPKLSNYYRIPITIAEGKLKDYKLNADFRGKNLPDILVLICKSVQCNYSSKNGQITLDQVNHL